MDGDYEAAPLTGNHDVSNRSTKKVTDCEVASPIGVRSVFHPFFSANVRTGLFGLLYLKNKPTNFVAQYLFSHRYFAPLNFLATCISSITLQHLLAFK